MDNYTKIQIRNDLQLISKRLEREINATPTGPAREKLTEANIHAMCAARRVQELLEMPRAQL